ncbi:hypothetical protein ACLOJK_011703 [Asimina triloba]
MNHTQAFRRRQQRRTSRSSSSPPSQAAPVPIVFLASNPPKKTQISCSYKSVGDRQSALVQSTEKNPNLPLLFSLSSLSSRGRNSPHLPLTIRRLKAASYDCQQQLSSIAVAIAVTVDGPRSRHRVSCDCRLLSFQPTDRDLVSLSSVFCPALSSSLGV